MFLTGVTFLGPETQERGGLDRLPVELRELLLEVNGFVAFRGGLHLRGVCEMPSWHSIDTVWRGAYALHTLFESVQASDVPFGQDYRGDQLLLRRGEVCRLSVERGTVRRLGVNVEAFLAAARVDPVDYLGLQPLRAFLDQGGLLRPGHVLDLAEGEIPAGWVRAVPANHAILGHALALNDSALAAG